MAQGFADTRPTTTSLGRRLSSPLAILAGVALGLAVLLTLRLRLPVGPFYWDLVLYLDAANRIADGQVPSADFFAPVGPLGYWLFALFARLFPAGQPLLLVQWSLLAVTAPLMALVLHDVDRRSRAAALALLAPFLVFAILPFNVEDYSSFPGADGFGIYNRQVCQLLYVLAAGLVFTGSQRILLVVVAGTMAALFLVKITGALSGLLLCGFALLAGRIAWRTALGAALAFAAGLAVLEGSLGAVSPYLGDILTLVTMNRDSILPRFLQAASIHVVVLAPCLGLLLALLVLPPGAAREPRKGGARWPQAMAAFLDGDAAWLAVAIAAALFFETQNTGGQAFIFVWPVLLRILIHGYSRRGGALLLLAALVAASALPTVMQVVQRAGRAFAGQLQYQALANDHLKGLGAVTQRREILDRAGAMIDVYRRYPEPYGHMADLGILPSLTLYADIDFQVAWLRTVDEAVGAILAYEAAHGVRFDTIMSVSFANPFPWLMDRHAPRHLAIGADPGRSVQDALSGPLFEAVAQAGLALIPKCPVTDADRKLLALYRPALASHRSVALSPCWDALVRGDLAAKP